MGNLCIVIYYQDVEIAVGLRSFTGGFGSFCAILLQDPVVAAQLGAIRKVTLDEAASMDEPGPDVLVFDVEGSRGKGRVTARFITVSATQEALSPAGALYAFSIHAQQRLLLDGKLLLVLVRA